MKFTLWGPKHKAIVRIYVQHTEAFIWRRSAKKPLEVQEDMTLPQEVIWEFLLSQGIDISTITTRRELASILYRKNLLVGDINPYKRFFQSAPRDIAKSSTVTSNVFNLADFRNRKK